MSHSRTTISTDMDIRNSFSELKKKLKHLLTVIKCNPGRTGADAGGERADRAGSLPQPEPHVAAGGSQRQDRSAADRPLQPGQPASVPVYGGEKEKEEGRADVDGREVSQACSDLHSEVGVVVGSGPGREGNGADGEKPVRVYPSLSALSIPSSGKPGGM